MCVSTGLESPHHSRGVLAWFSSRPLHPACLGPLSSTVCEDLSKLGIFIKVTGGLWTPVSGSFHLRSVCLGSSFSRCQHFAASGWVVLCCMDRLFITRWLMLLRTLVGSFVWPCVFILSRVSTRAGVSGPHSVCRILGPPAPLPPAFVYFRHPLKRHLRACKICISLTIDDVKYLLRAYKDK